MNAADDFISPHRPKSHSCLSAMVGDSEIKLEAELELPGYIGRVTDFAEILVFNARDRNCPHGCIGCVKHFKSKLHPETFGKRELSEHGQIEILVPVGAERVSAQISESIWSWKHKGGCVDPSVRPFAARVKTSGYVESFVAISVPIVVVSSVGDV